MIKNYKIFKESLLSKLKGPNEKEVWKNFGYEKGFDTPEEFFLDVIKDIKVKEQTKYPQIISWEKNGKIIFEQDFKSNMLYVDYDSIWLVFRKIFGLHYTEIYSFVSSMVEEHLNWKGFTLAGVDLSSFTITKEHLNWDKKYKMFKESLLNKLEGPKEEDFLNTIKENPIKFYSKAYFNKDEELKKISGDLITPEIKKETVYKLIDGFISQTVEDFYWKGLIYYDKKYNNLVIYGLPYDDWKLYLINKFDKNEYASLRKKLYNIYKDCTLDEIVKIAYKSFIDLEK